LIGPKVFMQQKKVLALKYRPIVLQDLIGQEIISETIFNSIKFNKIPNAFLFHGIRGTGKTSIARIIAKALNCENGIENLCKNKFCKNCEAISSSNHLDVIEQDCATATGIDSVRDLIEFCRYPPSMGKFKVLILDEIQAMSKAGAQSLLKILEEPPNYVKFVFCTTEIKKILVTMLSRCSRFDLSRVKHDTLFAYLKKIKALENGNISDDALKLICKCSEGSVRDALSLLDRALLNNSENKEISLNDAQEMFGHFDKSKIIELLKYVLEADESKIIKIYKQLYEAGVDCSTFLNEFLEILYYLKNIKSIKSSGNNFDLNDKEYDILSNLSSQVSESTLLLFWQFTINTMQEIKIVSNQNISIEMFLIRLLYIKEKKLNEDENSELDYSNVSETKNDLINKFKEDTKPVNQIKNVVQKDEVVDKDLGKLQLNEIKSFKDLLKICNEKKEMSLKYELETNVNLVNFESNKIEISFNENLNKDFVKILSTKLFEWTNKRWIIAFSQLKGDLSVKEEISKGKMNIINEFKNTKKYKKILEIFNDIELVEVEKKDD
tara:strand:+ start:1364 stop:3019 length:1656 start_codon:yes stop_codon:yes gene_type:complete